MVGAAFALSAVAADVVVDGKDDTPYVVDGRNVVAISGADLCWRTGDWFPAAAASAMAGQHAAGCACDGDIAPKDKCVAPMTATTVTKPASEPARSHFTQGNQTVVQGTVRFEQAILKTEGKTAIDREILARLPEFGGDPHDHRFRVHRPHGFAPP